MDKKRYIWQDDATYKLLETPKEVEAARKEASYKRGYEMGKMSYRWFPNSLPVVDKKQVVKFRLDYNEYCRGLTEGYAHEQKRLSEYGEK